jgi:pimeloyl-ACP methyl ester carboxylesterase
MSLRDRLADHFILRSTRQALEAEQLTRFELRCPSGMIEAFVGQRRRGADGEWIDGAWSQGDAEAPDLLVFKLPGTGGRGERSTLFPANLVDLSSEVWTWNPPGYGRSDGPATLRRIPPAATEFFSRILEMRKGPKTRLWICGNSLGCATGFHLATQIECDGLILRNPPPLVDLVELRDAWWNFFRGGRYVAAGIPEELDLIRTAKRVTAPAVFLESGADRLVTAAMQAKARLVHRGPHRHILMAGAAHDTPIDDSYREPLRLALRWLLDQSQD